MTEPRGCLEVSTFVSEVTNGIGRAAAEPKFGAVSMTQVPGEK
jgi:hypothetical protein